MFSRVPWLEKVDEHGSRHPRTSCWIDPRSALLSEHRFRCAGKELLLRNKDNVKSTYSLSSGLDVELSAQPMICIPVSYSKSLENTVHGDEIGVSEYTDFTFHMIKQF